MSFNPPNFEGATPDEIEQVVADGLSRLDVGWRTLPLFGQLMRHVTASVVEVIPFRQTRTKLEVLLADRALTETWWAGQRSAPGRVQVPTGATDFATSSDFTDPVDKVLRSEFGHSVIRTDNNVRIFDVQRRTAERGSEQAVIAWAEVDTAPDFTKPIGGGFFDTSLIIAHPGDFELAEGHADTIEKAVADYRQYG